MHETSLARKLIGQVTRIAANHPGTQVSSVEVEVGPLAGVEPVLLVEAFQQLAHNAFPKEVKFRCTEVPLRMRCEDCQAEFNLNGFEFRCPTCESSQLHVLSGESLELVNVSLDPLIVRRDVLAEEKANAEQTRREFAARGTLVVNLVASPGSGKTSLLQATARHWQGRYRMAVLVGDLETDRDARRLSPLVPVAQLTTGGACHLELPLVLRGWEAMGKPEIDFLFIENIGNLVCPASHDLAEHLRVVMLSVTEGDDKPGKYPKMFRTSSMLLISKTDLLPHVPFVIQSATEDALQIQPNLQVLTVSSLNGEGIEAWCNSLETQRLQLLPEPQTSSAQ